ncbi:MAG: HepT-like ribonuclease domain-containing protein [bacterium]
MFFVFVHKLHSYKIYQKIEWKKAIGMRNIISHQYFDINAEVVFHVYNI